MRTVYTVTLLSSFAALVLQARSADACSPPLCSPLFATPGSTGEADTVPANAKGVRVDTQDETQITLSRVVGDTTEEVETTATLLSDGSTLLEPATAFQAGEKYVLSGSECNGGPAEDPAPTFGTFTVTESAALPTELGTTVAAAPVRGLLNVIGGPACSENFDADASKVTLTLDASAVPWKSALVYELFVDGAAYRDFTVAPLAGENPYVAEATVYKLCVEGADGLADGTHQVAFHARLPGTDVALIAESVEVEISCGDTGGLGGAGGDTGAGGATTGGTTATGGTTTGGAATGGTTTGGAATGGTTTGGAATGGTHSDESGGSDDSGCSFGGVPAPTALGSALGTALSVLVSAVAIRRRKRR